MHQKSMTELGEERTEHARRAIALQELSLKEWRELNPAEKSEFQECISKVKELSSEIVRLSKGSR